MSIFLLEKISKIFKTGSGDFYALKDVSISFPSTGLISIVGKSGSGKSTLLNILLGIEKPSSGVLKFNGKQINKMSDKAFSKYHLNDVSMVFQHYNIFSELSAKENVMLPLLMKGYSKSKADKIVTKYFNDFSLDYLIKQKASLLSGGEKQRIAILRAIVTSPKVILCDEPTGALDSKNSLAIMEMLKELSKKILVVHVSHNKTLVNRFSDRIITLKDGMVLLDQTINESKNIFYPTSKSSYSSKWSNLFTKINLKINRKKNLFSIIACTVGFASILLSFGFKQGSNISQENALKNNLSLLHASASEKTIFEIENSPLNYEKSVRPSLESIDKNLDSLDVAIEPCLSYLFPEYPFGSYQNVAVENFQMVPLYDISLETYGKKLLVSGSPPKEKIDEVIVNEEFVKLLNKDNSSIIDDLFNISFVASINYSTGDFDNPIVKDDFSFDYSLRISAVVKEFSFLNTPKIYYSYKALKKELDTLYLENISLSLKRPTTILEYLQSVKEDDVVSNYCSEIFLTSIEDLSRFFETIKKLKDSNSTFQIESNAYDIQQSYKTFIDSFSTALFVFVIISFIGVNFILGMISLSTYIENKKNSAILTCLGARQRSIQSIYLTENYLLIFISIVLSIALSLVSQIVLNNIINKRFALDNLISIPFSAFYNVPFGLILFLLVIALFFSTIFTLTPMLIYRHISLSDELRDE